MNNSFKGFVSAKPENNFGDTVLFPTGRQNMIVDSLYFVNDRVKTLKTRELKTTVPPWKDATEQLAVVFKNDKGVGTRRFNATGYVRFDELSDEERPNYTEMGEDGYAVHNETGMRVVSEERTKQCHNILNQFMEACGLPIGSKIESLAGCNVSAEVKIKTYDNKDVPVIGSFRPVKEKGVVDLTEETTEVQAEY